MDWIRFFFFFLPAFKIQEQRVCCKRVIAERNYAFVDHCTAFARLHRGPKYSHANLKNVQCLQFLYASI